LNSLLLALVAVTLTSDIKTTTTETEVSNRMLYYAQQQAAKEEEIARVRQKVTELSEALKEAEEMEKLHLQQEAVLKEQIREFERAQRREGANLEYLKNIIVRLLETNERESLIPVLATLLQFTPQVLLSYRISHSPFIIRTNNKTVGGRKVKDDTKFNLEVVVVFACCYYL